MFGLERAMARPKELLRSSCIERAERKRKCCQSKEHSIAGGDICLVFCEELQRKSYCMACAKSILERAERQLKELSSQLQGVRN